MASRRGMFGNYYVGLFAESAVNFNRFVKKGSTDKYVVLCGADENPLGIVEEDNRLYNKDRTVRTGWVAHESIPVKATGEAVLELGSGGANKDDYIKSAANGLGVAYTFPTASDTYVKTELQAAINQRKIIGARALEAGDEGDFIRVLILK